MLRQLSRLEKTRSFIILFFVALLAISLIFFFAPARNQQAAALTGNEIIATVNGEEIQADAIARRREQLSRAYSGIDLSQLGIDEQRLLDGLIRDRVTTQEATRLGLGVSDDELRARIREIFTEGGQFVGGERYAKAAAERYGSVARFERDLRDEIASKKLRDFVTAGVQVSPAFVEEQFKRQGATFDVVYVPVTPDKLTAQIKPTDDDLKQYYEQHKTDYRILEPQKKVRYLFIDSAKVGEKLTFPDDELKAEYDKLPAESKRAGAKAQQILLKVATPELDASVREKATQLVAKARENGGMNEQQFAELVRGNSEDTATAKAGGNIVIKRTPAKAADPLQTVLAQAPNSISEPIKSGNAYYIVRRGDDIPKTFDEAKPEILVSLRNRKSYNAAADIAKRAADRLKQEKDFAKVAQEFAGSANMKPEDMVKETGFITPGTSVPNIGINQQFEAAIAKLENANDIGDQLGVPGGFAIPMLLEKREGNYLPPLEEAKEQVTAAYKNEKIKTQLEQFAQDIAKSAGNAAGLKAAAAKYSLDAKPNDKYKLNGSFEGVGNSAAADDALFAGKEGEVFGPFKIGDNYVVVGLNKRTEADMKEFDKQKESLAESELNSRQSQVFEDYISAIEDKMKADGKISIKQEVLDQVIAEAPPPAPQPRRNPNMPFNLPPQ